MRAAILFVFSLNAFAQWSAQDSHTQESLRGLSVVSEKVVWASGTHGTYLRTTDGGEHWFPAQVAGAEGLDFRDVEAFSAETAYLLAAGPGDQSRIYKTTDGGQHWELQITNREPNGFWDCMSFWDPDHGIIVGDPVNGKFQLISTADAGQHWNYMDTKDLPAARDAEGAFAASGTCITTQGKSNVWFVTGGSAARVFYSSNRGKTWRVTETPILHGPASAGIFSVSFRDAKHGVAAGGDYKDPEKGGANLATTKDGGKSWKLVSLSQQKYFSAITYVLHHKHWVIAAGPSGVGVSFNELKKWEDFKPDNFNSIQSRSWFATWGVGANGSIERWTHFRNAFR